CFVASGVIGSRSSRITSLRPPKSSRASSASRPRPTHHSLQESLSMTVIRRVSVLALTTLIAAVGCSAENEPATGGNGNGQATGGNGGSAPATGGAGG